MHGSSSGSEPCTLSVELEGMCRSPIERLIGVGSISLLHERLVSKRNSDDASVEKLNMKVR